MSRTPSNQKGSRQSGVDSASAYDVIMDAIVTQKLAPSQKVSENILTEMFEISRTTARNIMEQLTAQQFLVSVSPRITRVAPLTLLDVKQNFAMRKMLQPEIFAMAASQVNHAQISRMNEETSHSVPVEDDAHALRLLKANKQFNVFMAQQVKYPLLIHWIRQLEDTTMRIYWLYVKMNRTMPYTWEHQRALVEAIKRDASSDIREQVHKILSSSEERLLDAIFMHDQMYMQDLKIPE
ncbi:GntR family transcriptional regulator [uncultured Maricaulis sp.]|uniref:GntR family transcriptional regulator n=1 Tax=uncultured Maricaulis sp. TaxID=174710 RepID=UPI00260F5BAD|nr:GntR family transcriptional regulator [uncultured Maricaulis sp.]